MSEPKDKPRYMIDNNERDSKEIQRLLFSLGYKWLFYGTKVSYTNSCRFFANSDGYLAHSDEYYQSGLHKSLTLQELRNLVKKEGDKMSKYKIKVASEAESKEAQELLFELGYSWHKYGKALYYLDCLALFASEDGTVSCTDQAEVFDLQLHQEITLPQLRDLAVLHRNDVSDATHKCKNNDEKWFMTSQSELYYFHTASGKWQLHSATETEVILKDYAVPITQEQLQMTWQDALRAVAYGKRVEVLESDGNWSGLGYYFIDAIINNELKFRIAPQRKELNGNFTKEELLKIAGEMV